MPTLEQQFSVSRAGNRRWLNLACELKENPSSWVWSPIGYGIARKGFGYSFWSILPRLSLESVRHQIVKVLLKVGSTTSWPVRRNWGQICWRVSCEQVVLQLKAVCGSLFLFLFLFRQEKSQAWRRVKVFVFENVSPGLAMRWLSQIRLPASRWQNMI